MTRLPCFPHLRCAAALLAAGCCAASSYAAPVTRDLGDVSVSYVLPENLPEQGAFGAYVYVQGYDIGDGWLPTDFAVETGDDSLTLKFLKPLETFAGVFYLSGDLRMYLVDGHFGLPLSFAAEPGRAITGYRVTLDADFIDQPPLAGEGTLSLDGGVGVDDVASGLSQSGSGASWKSYAYAKPQTGGSIDVRGDHIAHGVASGTPPAWSQAAKVGLSIHSVTVQVLVATVPEPQTWALAGLGAAAVAFAARRRRG